MIMVMSKKKRTKRNKTRKNKTKINRIMRGGRDFNGVDEEPEIKKEEKKDCNCQTPIFSDENKKEFTETFEKTKDYLYNATNNIVNNLLQSDIESIKERLKKEREGKGNLISQTLSFFIKNVLGLTGNITKQEVDLKLNNLYNILNDKDIQKKIQSNISKLTNLLIVIAPKIGLLVNEMGFIMDENLSKMVDHLTQLISNSIGSIPIAGNVLQSIKVILNFITLFQLAVLFFQETAISTAVPILELNKKEPAPAEAAETKPAETKSVKEGEIKGGKKKSNMYKILYEINNSINTFQKLK